jgi:hypothetical protein
VLFFNASIPKEKRRLLAGYFRDTIPGFERAGMVSPYLQ